MLDIYKLAFKAYDIRGIYGQEIDERFCYILGIAIGRYMIKKFGKKGTFLLGSDVRDQNPLLINIFYAGMKEGGFENVQYAVFRSKKVTEERYPYGVCSTSTLYYMGHNDFDMSVSFTASHNPPEYVGMKFFYKDLELLSTDFLFKIFSENYKTDIRIPQLSFQINDMLPILTKKQKQMFTFLYKKWNNLKANHNFIVDFSNGAGVTIERQFFDHVLEGKQTVLFMNDMPDGKFSVHHSDTQEEQNYAGLIKKIQEKKSEFGLMFDGDADRIGIVGPDGKIIGGDIVTAIIAKQILQENQDLPKDKKVILYEVMSSKIIPEIIEKFGGKSLLVRVGRYFINKELKENMGLFAGESSGHFLFPEVGGYEMPCLALYYFIKELEECGDWNTLISKYLKYFKSPIISVKVDDKDLVIKNIKSKYSKLEQKEIDGVSVFGKDFWFNVRPSNTENKIKFTVEANNPEKLTEMLNELNEIIK